MKLKNFQLTDMLMKMYDNTAEAVFFFDREGRVISMNSTAEQILDPKVLERMAEGEASALCFSCKGYTNEQEIQTCLSCYLANPQDDFSSFQVYLDTRGKGGHSLYGQLSDNR